MLVKLAILLVKQMQKFQENETCHLVWKIITLRCFQHDKLDA
jgi:hypothetical protein